MIRLFSLRCWQCDRPWVSTHQDVLCVFCGHDEVGDATPYELARAALQEAA